MKIYQRFRIWVDEAQSGGLYEGKLVYAIGALPLIATPIFGDWWLIPGVVIAIAWMAFLLWRLWLMAKTGLIASDVPQGRLVEKVEKEMPDDTTTSGS